MLEWVLRSSLGFPGEPRKNSEFRVDDTGRGLKSCFLVSWAVVLVHQDEEGCG
jgi:hypothetical protein